MEKRRPIKRSMSGFEVEMFLLNSKGEMSNNSDKFIRECVKKNLSVKRECSKSMLEMYSYPSKRIKSTALDLFNTLVKTVEIAEKNDHHLYPFATYPGAAKPEVRKGKWYKIKEKVIGENFKYATHCCGYHQHYTLPRGLFNHKNKYLNLKIRSKIKKTFMDSYNMVIAMDPVMTTLLQSSPFSNNKYLAKDTRLLLYRGGKKLKFNKGVYSKLQSIGGLPPYKQTLGDLLTTLDKRQEKWKQLMKKRRISTKGVITDKNVLDFCWGPVKINMLGTLEYRGADVNLPKNLFSAAVALKFVLRKIQQEFTHVIPSDIGYEEPFKQEGNAIFIPPHSYVRNVLQPLSAYEGLKEDITHNYTKRFFKLAKSCVFDSYKPVLKPLQQIIQKRQTISDELIKQVQKRGYRLTDKIPQQVCQELALHASEKFIKGFDNTKKMIENVAY